MFRRGARKDGSSYIPRIRLNRANVRRRETFLSNLTFILSPSNLGRSHFPTLSFYILDLAVRARSMRVTHKSLLGQRWVDSSAFSCASPRFLSISLEALPETYSAEDVEITMFDYTWCSLLGRSDCIGDGGLR